MMDCIPQRKGKGRQQTLVQKSPSHTCPKTQENQCSTSFSFLEFLSDPIFAGPDNYGGVLGPW